MGWMCYGMSMPSRNILKIDVAESYYHVYARGINKAQIFHDSADYNFFISLFRRYLSKEKQTNKLGVPYPHLYGCIELLCYCVMPNHFHIYLYQIEEGSMARLMQGVMTSYSRYYNTKYQRRGPLYESRYKGSRIDSDAYFEHVSRYIHLNPKEWKTYPYSSLPYYLGKVEEDWIRPDRVLEIFNKGEKYMDFMQDYEGQKEMLEAVKHELADSR